MTVARCTLLVALPGLMFCIIPVPGMDFQFSWQLASIWTGGAAFAALLLSSWWWRAFFLLALARTATLAPTYEAYLGLVMIAIFLAAAEGFSRMNCRQAMDALCITALALLAWMVLQRAGLVPDFFDSQSIGPFNPDAGAALLALCLPAFYRRGWCWLVPGLVWGVLATRTTTGLLAAAAGAVVYLLLRFDRSKTAIALTVTAGAAFILWLWGSGEIKELISDARWTAWKHASWSLSVEAWGRGLGSWKDIFPLLASGERSIGQVTSAHGTIVMQDVFQQAHNEYVQVAFELGLQALALAAAFLLAGSYATAKGARSPLACAGMTALAVSCFGWHVFHIAPSALAGCAWLGIWHGEGVSAKGDPI